MITIQYKPKEAITIEKCPIGTVFYWAASPKEPYIKITEHSIFSFTSNRIFEFISNTEVYKYDTASLHISSR